MKINLDFIYPVGSIYETTSTVHPNILFGGTWELYGSGRVTVGLDSEDTDFGEVGKTGGEKTHTLTINEMPSHNHNATVAGKTAWGGQSSKAFEAGGAGFAPTGGVAGIGISKTGNNQPHNNLQPYVVVYRYRRIA